MKIDKAGFNIIRNTFIGVALIIVISISFLPSVLSCVICSIAVFVAVFVVRFFRLPQRELLREKNSVFAPADGTIVVCERVYEEEYLKRDCIQISVFMSIWNVHANWYPMAGDIEYFKHHQGEFLVAWHPKSSTDNERTTVVMRNGDRQILLRQIAGYIARRIICKAKNDKTVEQNDRMGFIKFGSRVDVFVPLDSEIKVRLNDNVVGSQTVLAVFSDTIK